VDKPRALDRFGPPAPIGTVQRVQKALGQAHQRVDAELARRVAEFLAQEHSPRLGPHGPGAKLDEARARNLRVGLLKQPDSLVHGLDTGAIGVQRVPFGAPQTQLHERRGEVQQQPLDAQGRRLTQVSQNQ
jgi:hypothetical protein